MRESIRLTLRTNASSFAARVLVSVAGVLCTLIGICNPAFATTIDVLWYTYADPASEYVSFYSSLAGTNAGNAGSYPESSGLTWNLTFFGPSSAPPTFSAYDVLVIH